MIRKAFALAGFLALGGCVSLPALHLPHLHAAAAPAPSAPAATVCTADMIADLEDKPTIPAGAKLPAPETQEMSAAFALYLSWLKSLSDWGQDGWDRVASTHKVCAGAHP